MTVLNLAITSAMSFTGAHAGGPAAWAVDVHDDGHWVEVAGYPSRAIAKEALAHLIDKGVPSAVLRVRRVPVE
jgi:hypothetical protein